jgi:predicted enzyme related to lactoylglutathione lyase
MPRVIYFEFQAADPKRAASFYKDVFGWQFSQWQGPEEYWEIKTGEGSEAGIDGGLMRQQGKAPQVYATLAVDDLDAYAEKIIMAGGEIVVEKMAIPGVGWHAYFKDTEGLVVGLHQADPEAK